uniref:Uncharacterized protein n=1 Tax=Noctiluca scintillans TaxID=2966 RepID=A0A7S1AUN6_NOCSC|mmetsp:Transcript_60782/g.161478  ORF Transcript_60782/g.161478 Transcript_60782/m.161478 type:complete len:294 (+) Transcript_60782:47-928(+)
MKPIMVRGGMTALLFVFLTEVRAVQPLSFGRIAARADPEEHPVEDAIEETLEGVGEVVEDITNPLMGSINVVRATLCIARSDIFGHNECLDFMLEYCTRARSIEGPCKKFWVLLNGGCSAHEVDVEHCCQGGEESCRLRRGSSAEETSSTTTTATVPAPTTTATVPMVTSTVQETTVTTTTTVPTVEPATPASIEGNTPVGGLDKRGRPLPEQGYDEHSGGDVEHENTWTASSDWGKEWPRHGAKASEEEICKEHPENSWCKLLLGRQQAEKELLEHHCWFSDWFWGWFWSFF